MARAARGMRWGVGGNLSRGDRVLLERLDRALHLPARPLLDLRGTVEFWMPFPRNLNITQIESS